MKKWPYPNVPIYVVCPRDGEGCSWTLHRNYLLPISTNIEQDEKDKPMATVRNTTSPTPVPPVHSASADAESSGMVKPSTAGSTTQVVWINLLYLDATPEPPRTDFHGGTRISVHRQIPVHLASWMHESVCVSVSMPYSVCAPFSGRVQCE